MDIEINTSSLRSDISRMNEDIEALHNNMQKMNDSILELSNMWDGSAHDAFIGQYSSDYDNMMEICSIIEKIIECMNYAATQYDKCDEEVKNEINSLKV